MKPTSLRLALWAGALSMDEMRAALRAPVELKLRRSDLQRVRRAREVISGLIARGETAYGVNTGFGSLASKRIPATELAQPAAQPGALARCGHWRATA